MLIISCEHARPDIPGNYQYLFAKQRDLLATHWGYDIGALALAQRLACLADFYLAATTSRLLVELNRSLHHPRLFSPFTAVLSKTEKQRLLANYYVPYRQQLEQQIQQSLAKGQPVIHISVHSFTPILNHQIRRTDIGLLYDSRLEIEKHFCQGWKLQLLKLSPQLKIRFNYPYQGKADGLTTYLRKQFNTSQYIGIELEVNQQYPREKPNDWQILQEQLRQSLQQQLYLWTTTLPLIY